MDSLLANELFDQCRLHMRKSADAMKRLGDYLYVENLLNDRTEYLVKQAGIVKAEIDAMILRIEHATKQGTKEVKDERGASAGVSGSGLGAGAGGQPLGHSRGGHSEEGRGGKGK